MLAGQLQADPFIDWVSDSSGSFDVILSGTGLGWSGTIVSPSGLWQLYSWNSIQYPFTSSNPNQPPIMIGNSGAATFLGVLPSRIPGPDPQGFIHSVSIGTEGGYQEPFNFGGPIDGQNPLNYGYLHELSLYGSFENWSGMSSFSVNSTPNVNDPSTWTWTAEYSASGESLGTVVPVPEPGVVSWVILAAFLGWIANRQRSKNQMSPCPIRRQTPPSK